VEDRPDIPSNEELNERIARAIAEGLCPSDGTPMSIVDANTLQCPKCAYLHRDDKPHGLEITNTL
jgi:hypothetical protein